MPTECNKCKTKIKDETALNSHSKKCQIKEKQSHSKPTIKGKINKLKNIYTLLMEKGREHQGSDNSKEERKNTK